MEIPIIFSTAGTILALMLLILRGRKSSSIRYLSFFFLLINAMSVFPGMMACDKPALPCTILFSLLLAILSFTGPVFYLYIKKLLTDDHTSKPIDLWHFLLPVVLFLTFLMGVIFPEVFVANPATIITNPDFLTGMNRVFFYGLIPGFIFPGVGFLMMFGYSIWSANIFAGFIKEKKVLIVLSKQQFMLRWLAVLLAMVFFQMAISALFFAKHLDLNDFSQSVGIFINQWFSSIGFLIMLISVFIHPAVMCGLPRLPQSFQETDYKKPLQELAYRQFIHQQLYDRMEHHKPYIQPQFDFAELSVLVNIPMHHLACYFRDELKQPFHTFRDVYRINYAKSLIKKGKLKEQSPRILGLLSGFSSYRKFLAAFFKVEGITVQEFCRINNY